METPSFGTNLSSNWFQWYVNQDNNRSVPCIVEAAYENLDSKWPSGFMTLCLFAQSYQCFRLYPTQRHFTTDASTHLTSWPQGGHSIGTRQAPQKPGTYHLFADATTWLRYTKDDGQTDGSKNQTLGPTFAKARSGQSAASCQQGRTAAGGC